jgi:hypothetical protein
LPSDEFHGFVLSFSRDGRAREDDYQLYSREEEEEEEEEDVRKPIFSRDVGYFVYLRLSIVHRVGTSSGSSLGCMCQAWP